MDDERDVELEREIRLTEIAHRHAMEFYNLLCEIGREIAAGGRGQPVSFEYMEELFRCAIEEAVGDQDRQRTLGYDPLVDRFPYL